MKIFIFIVLLFNIFMFLSVASNCGPNDKNAKRLSVILSVLNIIAAIFLV